MGGTERATLLADENCAAPLTVDVEGGTVVVFSAPDPQKSGQPNEDAALVVPLGGGSCVLAVADGMGGLPGGQLASRLALEALQQCVAGASAEGSSLRAAILDGFEKGNRLILERTGGGGTTLVAAAVHDWTVRPFHVGDSVALVSGQRGRVKLQTLAHSPVSYAVEAGVMSESEALHHDERHIVTNALGSDEMRIELGGVLTLATRDTLLLGSDGLFDNFTLAEIVELARCGPLERAVARLADGARERMTKGHANTPGKPDDVTIIAFRRDPDYPREADGHPATRASAS